MSLGLLPIKKNLRARPPGVTVLRPLIQLLPLKNSILFFSVSLILLLVCYLNFQVKGRLCTTLFKPRPVLVIEDEDPAKRAIRSVVNAEKTQES